MSETRSALVMLNMGEVFLQCGAYLLGIIIGELFHRVSLLIEEVHHVVPRHKKSNKRVLNAVFSNKHSQYVKVPLLVIVSVLLLYYGQPNIFCFEISIKICPVVVVWACLRMFGAFENSLEDMEILEESNAELGPGLAANYWFSFLKPALKADIRMKLEENLRPVLDLKVEMEADGSWKPQVGANYRNFNKLIIPLPDDCHLKIRDERILKSENIFKCTELCDGSEDCKNNGAHDLKFKLEAGQKRAEINQTVYWIYESSEHEKEADTEEKKEIKKNANKIFVIFDFPQLLQSAMGPDRGWEEKNRPGARMKNIHSFKKTLKSLLNCNEYIQYENDVMFLTFPNRERKEAGDQKKPLSAILREKILEEETQEMVYSSSSCSESDPC